MQVAPVYKFDPSEKPSLPIIEAPVVVATNESLRGYGCLVDDPDNFNIEIVRWPAQGWRPIDPGTGDEAGFVEGEFRCQWKGDVLYGVNEASTATTCLAGPRTRNRPQRPIKRDRATAY